MKKILLLIILFQSYTFLIAQKGEVSGYIFDKERSETIAHVLITVDEQERLIESNEDGYFSIDNLIPGQHVIHFQLIGYFSLYKEVELKAAENMVINVFMLPNPNQLDEVNIVENAMDKAKAIHPVEIINKVEENENFDSSVSEATQTIFTSSGSKRTFILKAYSIDNNRKQLMEYISPSKVKGTDSAFSR